MTILTIPTLLTTLTILILLTLLTIQLWLLILAILTRLRLRDTSTSIDGKNWIILSDMIKFKAYFQELLLCPRITDVSKIVFRGQNNLDLQRALLL